MFLSLCHPYVSQSRWRLVFLTPEKYSNSHISVKDLIDIRYRIDLIDIRYQYEKRNALLQACNNMLYDAVGGAAHLLES